MALRVWLPLNDGTIVNKGLSGALISNTGATVNTNGKIGKCYSFGTSTSYLEIPSETMTNFSECTLSFWINIISWNTSYCTIFQAGANGYAWKDYVFGVLRNGANSTLCFTFGNGSTSSQANYLTPTLNTGTWYHLTFSYKSGQYAIYVNGEQTSAGTTTYTVDFTKITRILVGCSNNKSSYQSNCLINDIRIYDECLSLKQIKEISKGLIVHYQLKNPRAISNLKRNTNYGTYNNFASSGSTCTVVKTGETYNGADVWRMTYTPNDTSLSSVQSSLHSHGVTTPGQTYLANTKYCYWTLFKPISHSDTRVGGTASNIAGWTEIAPEYWGDGWYVVGQKRTGNVTEDKTDTIFTSFKTPSATSGTPIIIDFCCPHLVEGYDYILEEFDYIGTNPTYEVDSSGNGYNGTINGTLTLSDDTARYLGSIKFDANTSYIKLPALTTTGFANSFTIIYWAKITDMNGKMAWGFEDGNRLNIYPTGSVICCNTGDSANNPYQNNGTSIGYSQWNNGWHQFAMTADGTSNKLYVDGVLQGTAKTYKGMTGTQIYLSGWASGNNYRWTDGSISDFRIYATALSADDIKELYQTSAIIDNGNNMYTYEFVEE